MNMFEKLHKIKTLKGILFAEVKGTENENPGIDLWVVKENGDTVYVAMVEWDTVKEKFQIVVYDDYEDADMPSDIIELNNVMKYLI